MRKHITWALALGLLLTGSTAFAQNPPATAKPNPAQRLHIAKRMRDGVQHGQLTRPEAKRLRERFMAIRKHGQELRKDGTLTPAERQQLRQEWRKASRALFLLRHNKQRRR